MSLLFAIIRFACIALLLWFALDWRSPFLASIRSWALCGLLLGPLAIALLNCG